MAWSLQPVAKMVLVLDDHGAAVVGVAAGHGGLG
jgi:hypothetical protein